MNLMAVTAPRTRSWGTGRVPLRLLAVGLALALGLGAAYAVIAGNPFTKASAAPKYQTSAATLGSVQTTVSATGPMFGAAMRRPEAEAAEREQAVFERSGLDHAMLTAHAKLGEGTRRPARVRLSSCTVDSDGDALRLQFELPAGAYATTVLREVMKPDTL